MDNLWATVDQLIHDLGAIRAFLDEADVLADGAEAPQVAEVRGAMDDATTAITRIFSDGDKAVIALAWEAIARAQDAVRAARAAVAGARSGRESAGTMTEQARQQAARARARAQAIGEQALRARAQRPLGAADERPRHPKAD